MAKTASLTPMLRHYLEVKAEHEDAVLLYRMGDFFELFFDDAVQAAPILEVTLTARQKGSPSEAPMCGVPHHAIDGYIGKLLAAGLKVAICDQVENPAEAKGLVKREVTRVITPGTVSEPALLEGKEDNFLAAVVWNQDLIAGSGGGAFLDVSTGRFFARRWSTGEQAAEDLEILRPREVLIPPGGAPAPVLHWADHRADCRTDLSEDQLPDRRRGQDLLERQLGTATLRGFGLDDGEPAARAAAAALAYARETQRSDLSHVRSLSIEAAAERLAIDPTTLANLEVFRNMREGGRKGTLLSVLDRTVTPPGGRMLRGWLRRPLTDPEAIRERHLAVEELTAQAPVRDQLRTLLAQTGDPERLVSRSVLGTLTPREAAALRDALAVVPEIFAQVATAMGSRLLSEVARVDPLPALHDLLAQDLLEAPAANLRDGGVIAEGVDEELDRCRSLARDSKQHILSLEAREREATGIASLKIRYNRVFGYYLEVTKAQSERVPDHYIRKQTLVNAERYITPEVKELEEQILTAEEKQIALEEEHFTRLRKAIAAQAAGICAVVEALARLDVLASFAEVAVRNRYSRPLIGAMGDPIVVAEGRHAVVEAASTEPFVPNDIELNADEAQIVLLTGPNMGGKSTYLRQVALISLMAQAGSFVPVGKAELGVVDRIFSRVGASDDLARGESTFMVEMIETANILHHATDHSLVILDEVGRGTATFDGLSLAWAIVEFLHEKCRAKTLFATHYHELTELASMLPRVVNRKMAVKEWEDRIVFLRRVIAGSADKSYGLHVARLAGLPASVIERAGEILANLEAQEYDFTGNPTIARGNGPSSEGPDQLTLFAPPEQVIASVLRDVDVDLLSPLAALNLLHSLKARLGGE